MADVISEVDPQRPSASRIYDFFLGGTHNFAADRQVAAEALAVMPELPAIMRANRDFLRRAVTLAAHEGVDQFLDLGSGIPAEGAVHEVARKINKDARVVYADTEPVAVVHARRLLDGDPATAVLLADLTDADHVLESAAHLLDLDRPICVLVASVAHFVPDTELLGRALQRYREAAAPGSYLVLSHATDRGDPERGHRIRMLYNNTTAAMVLRGRAEVRALTGDWSLVEPGLTTPAGWRPEPGSGRPDEVVDGSLLVVMAHKSGRN